jgi:hypothetical protein
MDPPLHAPAQVVHHHIGGGEVDGDLGVRASELSDVVVRVDPCHQLQTVGGLDRGRCGRSHAST